MLDKFFTENVPQFRQLNSFKKGGLEWLDRFGAIFVTGMLFHKRNSIGSLLFSFAGFSICPFTYFRRPNAPSVRELTLVLPKQRKWEKNKCPLQIG